MWHLTPYILTTFGSAAGVWFAGGVGYVGKSFGIGLGLEPMAYNHIWVETRWDTGVVVSLRARTLKIGTSVDYRIPLDKGLNFVMGVQPSLMSGRVSIDSTVHVGGYYINTSHTRDLVSFSVAFNLGVDFPLNPHFTLPLRVGFEFTEVDISDFRSNGITNFRLSLGLSFNLRGDDTGDVQHKDLIIAGGLACASCMLMASLLPSNTRFMLFSCGGGQVGCGEINLTVAPNCSGGDCGGGGGSCSGVDCSGGSSGGGCSGGGGSGDCSGGSSSGDCSGGSSSGDCSGGGSTSGSCSSSSSSSCMSPRPYPLNRINVADTLKYYIGGPKGGP